MGEIIVIALGRATLEVLEDVRGGKYPTVPSKYDPRGHQPRGVEPFLS